MSVRAGVVIPAAGAGTRMGGVDKVFIELAGEAVLARAIRPFLADSRVVAVAVALEPRLASGPPDWLRDLDGRILIVSGGSERGDSVRHALQALPEEIDVIAVHDAARPMVSADLVSRAIDEAANGRSVVAAVPLIDTVHEVSTAGRILRTPDRSTLWAAQTPQAFPAAVLREAHYEAAAAGVAATDDAALVARFVGPVHVMDGERDNIKITVATDLVIAEALIRARS